MGYLRGVDNSAGKWEPTDEKLEKWTECVPKVALG